MKENSILTKSKGMATTYGLTAENMKAFGKTTKCMVKVSLHGTMAGDMKANTFSTKNKEEESLHGLTEDLMTVCGKMENNKDKGFTDQKMAYLDRDFGKMGEKFAGQATQQPKNEMDPF